MKNAWKIGILGCVFICIEAMGNPSEPNVISGKASFTCTSPELLEITLTDQAIINWKEFSIGLNETTRFNQPSTNSSVLNRVLSDRPSQIFGSLEANGRVILINPNGILVDKTGVINTGSFIASTLDVLDDTFLENSQLLFKGDSKASIVQLGTIRAFSGDVALLGRTIENSGQIIASNGTGAIVAAQEILIMPDGKEKFLIRPQVSVELKEGIGILNEGSIEAMQVELRADGNPYALAINHKGKAQALGIQDQGGRVFIVAEKGANELTGSIDAPGGEVYVLADSIYLKDQASIDVSGESGGGKVLIGGDEQGLNPEIYQAKELYADGGTSVKANALHVGNGGRVIAWATDVTGYLGNIEAKGGIYSGDGGFVEVSSPGKLAYHAHVDTTSPFGKIGTLLLDPSQIDITGATLNVALGNCGYSALTYASNMNTGTLDVATLETDLLANTITIRTANNTCPGLMGNGSITLSSPLTIAALSTGDLILDAFGDILINNTIINNSSTSSIYLTAGADSGAGSITIGGFFVDFTGAGPSRVFSLTANSGLAINNDIQFDQGPGVVISDGSLVLSTPQDIHVQSNILITGSISVGGLTAGSSCGTLFIDAISNADNANASLISNQLISDVIIRAQNVDLAGSTTVNDANATLSAAGNNTIIASGNVILTAGLGSGPGSSCSINALNPGKTLSISAENVTVQSGTGATSGAFLQSSGPILITTNSNGVSSSGNLSVTAVNTAAGIFGTDVTLNVHGDFTAAANATAAVSISANSVFTLNYDGFAHLNAGTSSIQILGNTGVEITGTGTYPFGTPGTAGNFTMSAGTNGTALLTVNTSGPLNITIPGDLNMTAGAGVPFFPFMGIFGCGPGGTTDMNISVANLNLTAGFGIGAFIGSRELTGLLPGGDGTVTVNASGPLGITINGGSAANAKAAIGTSGGTVPGNVSLTTTVGNIILNSSTAAGSTASIESSGNINAISANSMSLNDFSFINATGNIVLVTDNKTPQPGIGSATFTTDSLSTISANSGLGSIQIFATLPPLVTILGTLNGSPYVQGTAGVDSDQERYFVFYPNSFVNPNAPYFTIFYKLPGPAAIIQSLAYYETVQRGMQEFLTDLQAYLDFDFFNFSELFFKVSFAKNAFAHLELEDTVARMFRRQYTNYNLRRINLLK